HFSLHDRSHTALYPLSLHDALPIYLPVVALKAKGAADDREPTGIKESVLRAGAGPDAFVVDDHLLGGKSQRQSVLIEGEDGVSRSEEHTSELQSRENLVCRLLLEKK